MANEMSILKGIDEVIHDGLRIHEMKLGLSWWHMTTALLMSDPPPRDVRGIRRLEQRELEAAARKLPMSILERLEANCGVPETRQGFRLSDGGSDENWRIEKQTKLDPKNRSPEVRLERHTVQETGVAWINQIPTASGFSEDGRLGRCAVDLAHDCGNGGWELIELKVGSDNPFYAAMEILQYGMLYVFSRLYYPNDHPARRDGLLWVGVKKIGLRVLGPEEFFDRRLRLGWLNVALGLGLGDVLKNRCPEGLDQMDFDFCVFDWVPPAKALEARLSYEWPP